MRDAYDPSVLAAKVWEQAAVKVSTLHRGGVDAEVESWNDAIERAVELLKREAENVGEMGRMARMLITGNTDHQE
jgi:hypothetical protein